MVCMLEREYIAPLVPLSHIVLEQEHWVEPSSVYKDPDSVSYVLSPYSVYKINLKHVS